MEIFIFSIGTIAPMSDWNFSDKYIKSINPSLNIPPFLYGKGRFTMATAYEIGDSIELIETGNTGSIEEIYNSKDELPEGVPDDFEVFPIYEVLYLTKSKDLETCYLNESKFRRAPADLSSSNVGVPLSGFRHTVTGIVP
jgi:hypothetical protein